MIITCKNCGKEIKNPIKNQSFCRKSNCRVLFNTKQHNKNCNRVEIKFKPDDKKYYEKWVSTAGSNNLEKIKTLLDK